MSRERLDRGLEPIGQVLVRVIEAAAVIYQRPWLAETSNKRKLRQRERHHAEYLNTQSWWRVVVPDPYRDIDREPTP